MLEEGDDVFGDTVNTAARLAALCKPDQILASGQLVDALPPELLSAVRFFDEVMLRGKQVRVHELLWEISDATVAGDYMPQFDRLEHTHCTLIIEDRIVEMDADFEMGRADDVELQCRGALASRKHALLEYRRGRFILTDQSANGTFVNPNDAEPITLKRDYCTLGESGLIGLGEEPGQNDPFAISYRCR